MLFDGGLSQRQQSIYDAAAAEAVNRFNNRMFKTQYVVMLAAILLSGLEFLGPQTLGLTGYEIPRFVRWYATDTINALWYNSTLHLCVNGFYHIHRANKAKDNSEDPPLWPYGRPLLLAVPIMLGAAHVENLQAWRSGNAFDWMDMGAYGLGCLAYAAIFAGVYRANWRRLENEIRGGASLS